MTAGAGSALIAAPRLTGVQKAALVLMNMSTERAAAVLRSFAPEEAEEITAEMARVREIDGRDAEVAIREFHEDVSAPAMVPTRTGRDVATELIEASFEGERAADLLERIAAPGSSASFAFLDDLEPARIVTLLEQDPAETVAFVLVQLGPDLAAKILMQHETQRRLDIAQAIAMMGSPAPEAGGIVADVLRRRAKVPVSQTFETDDEESAVAPVLRVQPLVDIMNHAEPADEGELLSGLRDRDSRLADEIRAKLLSFDDVPKLQDRDLQQVLRGVDISQLALALKGAADDVATAIKANMSERNRQTLAEETAELGRVTKKSVEEARNLVVRAIRELAGTGGLELKKAEPEPGAQAETPVEDPAEPEEEYVD